MIPHVPAPPRIGAVLVPQELAVAHPRGYCIGTHGDCLVPVLHPDDVLFVCPDAPLRTGGLVILRGEDGIFCKRLVRVPDPGTIGQPAAPGHVLPPVVVTEMLHPAHRVFHFRADRLRAVHSVVGRSDRGLGPMRPIAPSLPGRLA